MLTRRPLSLVAFVLTFAAFGFGCAKETPVESTGSNADTESEGDDDDAVSDSSKASTPAASSGSSDDEAVTPAATGPSTTTVPEGTPAATPGDGTAVPVTPVTPTTPVTPVDTTPVVTTPPPVTPPVVVPPPIQTAACSNGGVREIENNDSLAAATSLGSGLAFCGAIGGAGDNDNYSFTLPADAKSMSWSGNYSVAQPTMTWTVNGVTTPAGQNPAWAPGAVYTLTINAGGATDYAFAINIVH